VAHGERFAFDRLYSRTCILREKVPQAVDGLDLPGGGEPFGGYSYLGALYVLAPKELSPLAEELHASLSSLSCVLASASSFGSRLCAARVVAQSAIALYRTLNECRTVARAYLELPPAAREVW
jgi:urease accessory protein UreH